MMNYFIHNGEETQGPYSEEEIRSRLKAGKLLSTSQICQEIDENWKPIAEVFEQLEYKLPPPPVAHLKRPVDGNIKGSEEEPPISGYVSPSFSRSFREVYMSGLTPALKFAAPVAGVGGFVSDVLQPIAPFSLYLFLISLLVTITTGIWIWIRRLKSEVARCPTCARICFATAVSSFVLGITWVFFTSTNPDKGFLATRITSIEGLQVSLLGVQQSVGRVETKVSEVSTDVTEIKADVKDISKGVTSIAKMGGLIKDPTTAMEHYNNALIYRERGDVGSARKSLEDFLRTGEEKIDPILMLLDALRSMESPEGAKDAYLQMIKKHPENLTLRTFFHSFLPREERVPYLIKIIQSNPDYTPAYYEYLGKGSMGYLFSKTGNGLVDITHSLHEETNFVPYITALSDLEGIHQEIYLNKELKDQGIDPAKQNDDAYKSSVADFSIKFKKAQTRAELRLSILDREKEVAHCEAGLEAVNARILSYESKIKDAFDSISFWDIYNSYLKLKQKNSLRKYYYDPDQASYESYPEMYLEEVVERPLLQFKEESSYVRDIPEQSLKKAREDLAKLRTQLEESS